MSKDPFEDYNRHLLQLPDHILRDLARNDCAQRSYRKTAVEILCNRKSQYAKHEDLRELVEELQAEFEGIQFEFPAITSNPGPGPMTCGVTTKTMFGQDPSPEELPAPESRKSKKKEDVDAP